MASMGSRPMHRNLYIIKNPQALGLGVFVWKNIKL